MKALEAAGVFYDELIFTIEIASCFRILIPEQNGPWEFMWNLQFMGEQKVK